MKSRRRDFLSSSALLLGGFTSGIFSNASGSFAQENIPGAESWNPEPGVRKKDDKLLNIGGIFGLWSHTSSTWWRYLNPPQGHARATGLRITHLWCVDKEAGRRLAKRYDATLVDSYDDMVGKVDGMFIDDFFATPFMPDLSMPYLEAGIPCFRPTHGKQHDRCDESYQHIKTNRHSFHGRLCLRISERGGGVQNPPAGYRGHRRL